MDHDGRSGEMYNEGIPDESKETRDSGFVLVREVRSSTPEVTANDGAGGKARAFW